MFARADSEGSENFVQNSVWRVCFCTLLSTFANWLFSSLSDELWHGNALVKLYKASREVFFREAVWAEDQGDAVW